MLEGRNYTTKYGKNIMWNVNQVSYLRCAKRFMKPNDEKYATAFTWAYAQGKSRSLESLRYLVGQQITNDG